MDRDPTDIVISVIALFSKAITEGSAAADPSAFNAEVASLKAELAAFKSPVSPSQPAQG